MTKAIRSLIGLFPLVAALCIAPAAGVADAVNDDLYSFQVSISGECVAIPVPYQQMVDSGWTYEGDDGQLLKPEEGEAGCKWKKGSFVLSGEMVNTSWDVLPVKECVLAAVTVSGSARQVALPGGVSVGASLADEVVEAYGTPSDTYQDDDSLQYTYQLDYDQEAVFTFEPDTGVLSRACLRNVVMSDAPDLKTAAPAPGQDYQAPDSLGEDPLSLRVAFGNALYALPAPVSAFVENGWTLGKGADGVVKACGVGQLTLSLNSQSFTTWVYNASDKAALARDCLVTTVVSDLNRGGIPLTLPGGVTIGMPEKDALDALASLPVKTSQTADLRRYVLSKGRAAVILSVERDTGVISRVEVASAPDSAGK